ncbi:hypothetical protein [Phenylobacterium sp.]|jgi:hypothetical protein|uniref:hypothetical protein n=1 Tax=Phenylobacterium sp. TaxID=1871053 RepID=UPI002F944F63
MDDLTDAEVGALRNLAHKRDGVVAPFINIADARRLTDLGLARRSRQGWDITAAGAAVLARLGPGPAAAGGDVVPF